MTDTVDCPTCDRPLVRVRVPPELREFAPDGSAAVGSCPRCLRTHALESTERSTDDAERPTNDASVGVTGDIEPPSAIPDGDGGVAVLLALGLLDSVATNRPAIQSLIEHAERSGTDFFLALDRLAADESVDAHVDIERRRRQLESMLE